MTPDGWETRSIGSLLSSCDYGISTSLSSDPIGVPVLRMGNIKDDKLDLTSLKYADLSAEDPDKVLLRPGDILFNRTNSRDLVGKVALVTSNQPLGFASYLLRLRTNHSVTCEWLWIRMASPDFQQKLREIATPGVSQSNINPTRMRELVVSVPPLFEQEKIAAILGSVGDAIQATQAVIDQTRMVRSGLLQRLLTRGIGHTQFRQTEIGEMPSSWRVLPVGSIAARVRQPVDALADQSYREIGIRSHGKGIFHKPVVQGQQLGDKSVFQVEPGCLVVNIVFAWEGAVAATSDAEQGMIASHRFPMYRPDPSVDLRWLTLFFKSSRGIQALGSASPGGAGRNRTLNQKDFLRLLVPVPSVSEQLQVSEIIESVDASLKEYADRLDTLVAIKHGLMQNLLTGRTRVDGLA